MKMGMDEKIFCSQGTWRRKAPTEKVDLNLD
jgi:hypothetical protein